MHGHWNQAIQNLTLNVRKVVCDMDQVPFDECLSNSKYKKRIKQRLKRNGKERGSGQSGSDGPKTCILSQSCKHIWVHRVVVEETGRFRSWVVKLKQSGPVVIYSDQWERSVKLSQFSSVNTSLFLTKNFGLLLSFSSGNVCTVRNYRDQIWFLRVNCINSFLIKPFGSN